MQCVFSGKKIQAMARGSLSIRSLLFLFLLLEGFLRSVGYAAVESVVGCYIFRTSVLSVEEPASADGDHIQWNGKAMAAESKRFIHDDDHVEMFLRYLVFAQESRKQGSCKTAACD